MAIDLATIPGSGVSISRVLEELKRFVDRVFQMAVEKGYIALPEKQEFLMPIAEKMQVISTT